MDNHYRRDDVSAVALFYLDKPEMDWNVLPSRNELLVLGTMQQNNKRLIVEEEIKKCVGTCFACVPQCERLIPEKIERIKTPGAGKPKKKL